MRSIANRASLTLRLMDSTRRTAPTRYFSDGKGRVFSEEERAAETIYIKKMEREKLEKLKAKAEKEKNATAVKDKADKKSEGEGHKG